MGRYYTGSIEGKFWFAVQSSNAPERFGADEYEPQYIVYNFDRGHIDGIKKELETIETTLVEDLKRLDDFFAQTNGYNTEMIIDWYKKEYKETINEEEVKDMLVEYADYELGKQILECVEEEGYCEMNCEL